MNILTIFTGGTIGSKVTKDWISPNAETNHILLNKYKELTGDTTTIFTAETPYTILSENLSATELNLLSKCIAQNLSKNYDGIVVTHGTDTLQYTASALEYQFADAKIPIILVSSDYPLGDVRANGMYNLIGAVDFIKSKMGQGVFVSYKNTDKSAVNIHIPTRLFSHSESNANVYSIGDCPYAFCNIENHQVKLNDNYKSVQKSQGTGLVEFCSSPDILMINSYPQDNFHYNLDTCKAVIIKPYHSGTLNTNSVNFANFCNKAKEKNIPVFLVNIASGITYESAKLYDNLGLIVLPFCSSISIYMKCWIAISQGKNLKDFILTPLSQEFHINGA